MTTPGLSLNGHTKLEPILSIDVDATQPQPTDYEIIVSDGIEIAGVGLTKEQLIQLRDAINGILQ